MDERSKILFGDIGILLCAFFWGTSYSATKIVLNEISLLWFLSIRFIIAGVAIFIIFHRRFFALPRRGLMVGMLGGGALAANYIAATIALLFTTAGNQAFITTTFVVMVPLIYWAITRRFPGFKVISASLVSFVGLCLLTIKPGFNFNYGDLLSLVSAFFLSIHMIILDKYNSVYDPVGLTVAQILFVLVSFIVVSVALEPFPSHFSKTAVLGLVYIAIMATLVPFLLQNVAQKYTTANHTAIIMATEGIFGAFFGIVILGEVLTPMMFFACALIFAGALIVELKL